MTGWARRAGLVTLAVIALAALFAPALSPNPPATQLTDRVYAPPMRVHLRDATGWRAPFVYPQILEERIVFRFREDVDHPTPLIWFANGHVASIPADRGPLLLLGADRLGRDVFSRLLDGTSRSLGVAVAGTFGALLIGALVGGLAGSQGGRLEGLLMLTADFVVVLPGAYLVLVLRGLLPIVLEPDTAFALMAGLFALSAWPHVARGVRAVVAAERTRDYAEAARASGAGPLRVAWHLVPAARGFLAVQIVLLVPALLVAEATVSYFGLGFVEPTASWGTMLQDAGNIALMADAPWLLAPAVAIFVVVLSLNLLSGARAEHALFGETAPISSRS
ncbi:MAG TPA: ABC transporter permease [Vicinamibacterales bacterium]|nr:ABC transporter permease [Vicinamibacterales bacterium]